MKLNKKGVLFLFSIIIFILFLLSFVYSEETQANENDKNNGGRIIVPQSDIKEILDKVKLTTKNNWDKFTNHTSHYFLMLVGVKSFNGKWDIIWSLDFWKYNFWYYFFTFSLPTFLFFRFFHLFMEHNIIPWIKNFNIITWIKDFKLITWIKKTYYRVFVIIILILYPFLMGIPLANRFLQIMTLEILGLHWFWRSFIFATILFFIPKMRDSYVEYVKIKRDYQDKLEKVAGEEIAKAMARA
ncbi:MAG: hypothetical protein QW727_00355 [Candidatus Pacearchaeota archaeon]